MLEPGALGPLLWAGKWRYQAWETSVRRAALPASGLREAPGCSWGVHRTVPHWGRGSPALTKASGSGPVYMMHSSQEHQAPGRLPCSSSRKEGGGPQGQTGDAEELEAAVPPGSHRPRTMGPHWVRSSSSGVQAPAAHPAGGPPPSCFLWRAGPCSPPGSWGHRPRDTSTSTPQPPASCPTKGWWPPEQHGHPDPRVLGASSRDRESRTDLLLPSGHS